MEYLTSNEIAVLWYISSRKVRKLCGEGIVEDAIVLDFFVGSGTVERVCIKEGRSCLMCDSDKFSLEYFEKYFSLMKGLGQNVGFKRVENIDEFFE